MEETQTTQKSSSNTKIFLAAAVVVIIVTAVFVYKQPTTPAKPTVTVTPTLPIPSHQSTVESAKTPYKDGSYEAVGNYVSPGGDETLDVKVTLANGVVTDATVTPQATRPMSKRFQGIFTANYKQYVIGKSIDQIKLDKVSGSSLAPKGFNDALDKIKTQAKA